MLIFCAELNCCCLVQVLQQVGKATQEHQTLVVELLHEEQQLLERLYVSRIFLLNIFLVEH
jgi:hypothetical protein